MEHSGVQQDLSILYGSPANFKAQSIELCNNLEAKVLDSIGSEPRKIKGNNLTTRVIIF